MLDYNNILLPPVNVNANTVILLFQHTKLSCLMRKPTMWFLNRSNTNRAVQPQKTARKFKKKRNCTLRVTKTKVMISFAVTAKLSCIFVFAYENCWFSYEVAQIMTLM